MKKNKGILQAQYTIFIGAIIVLIIIGFFSIVDKKNHVIEDTILVNNEFNIPNEDETINESLNEINDIQEIEKQKVVPNLTLSIAKELVNSKYGSCLKNECKELLVTINNNDTVTAIYTLYDDAIYQEKKVGKAIYKNGVWSIEKAFITYSCNRDHVDGKLGFAPSACI